MRYEKYKSSGIEWIGEIPSHWEEKKFRYVFSFGRGLSITKENLQDNGVPCVSYGEIHSRYGFEVNPDKHSLRCVSEDYLNSSPNSLLKKGDFVFADTSEDIEGSGNFTYLNSDVPVFAGYHTIVAKPSQKFIYRYIAYFLDSIDYRTQIRRVVNGTKVYSITQSILKGTNIILPPIPEQTTIANFLDEKTSQIDKLISNKQKLIELLKEERTAIINEAVSGKGKNWEKKKLKYVVSEKLKYGANEPAEFEVLTDPRYFRITDFGDDGILRDDTFKSLPFEKAKDYLLKDGDILFARSGATVGKTFQFKNFDGVACFAGYLIKASPDTKQILSDFLYYFTKSGLYENWKDSIFNQATIQNIGADKYSLLEVPVPPLKEQNAIVEHIQTETQRIDNTISKIEKEIELMNEYRTSLISEVVTGKIKVA